MNETKKILVVDDEPQITRVLRRSLAEREGGRPVFSAGGILFDGAENIIPATLREGEVMMEGLYSQRDVRRYFIGVVLRYVWQPHWQPSLHKAFRYLMPSHCLC